MTRACEILPEAVEAASVTALLELSRANRRIGAPRSLLYAAVNWDAMNVSANPPGAPAPRVARTTYTREARREQRQRQLARRSGQDRFLSFLFRNN